MDVSMGWESGMAGQWEGDFIRYSTLFHFSTTTKNAVLWRCVI